VHGRAAVGRVVDTGGVQAGSSEPDGCDSRRAPHGGPAGSRHIVITAEKGRRPVARRARRGSHARLGRGRILGRQKQGHDGSDANDARVTAPLPPRSHRRAPGRLPPLRPPRRPAAVHAIGSVHAKPRLPRPGPPARRGRANAGTAPARPRRCPTPHPIPCPAARRPGGGDQARGARLRGGVRGTCTAARRTGPGGVGWTVRRVDGP
jgi:hypothetical protein